ncbi:hypothetical protein DASB73_005860 [Starmerella bacillaris]|uniref:Uncharacterized protein n=1 Tax=Starmerella bacillaris TaxID=1247836 RepID=A0AAV5RES6_STABA|nr:hypothetical protein DASB73_005860 [Starmerella bacillaris]
MAAPRQVRQSVQPNENTTNATESKESNQLYNELVYQLTDDNMEVHDSKPTMVELNQSYNELVYKLTDDNKEVYVSKPTTAKSNTKIAEPIKSKHFGNRYVDSSTIDFQHVFPRASYTIMDISAYWTIPEVSTTEPKDFEKETKRLISVITTDLAKTFQEKIRDTELIPFAIFILMRTFLRNGTASFHNAGDEQYQDVLLYRGIYSALTMSCTEQQLNKILPECYSVMFSTELKNTLTQRASSLEELKGYMESLPYVESSPTFKVHLFKQLAQLATWADKYESTNINDTIMEYQLRLTELSRQTTLSVGLMWISNLSKTRSYKTDKILDYLNSRNASAEASHIEIDELLSNFQASRNITLPTDNKHLPRRAKLKILLTEEFESISYVWKNITNERPTPKSTPQITALRPPQRQQQTPTSKSHCPHRDNHSNRSVKQLNPQDWAKSYNLLYYITRLIIILVKKCSIDQAEATLDNLMTKLHFGHGKSFAYEIAGINNSTLKKNIERCGVYERGRNLTGPDDLIPGLPWTHLYSSNAKPWRGKSQITTDSKRIKKHYYTLELAPKDMIEPDLQDAELNLTTLETHEAKDSWYILDSN